MFFQNADDAKAAAAAAKETYKTFAAVSAELNSIKNSLVEVNNYATNSFKLFEKLVLESEQLNKSFSGTRLRFQEFAKAINEAVPDVARLGGEYEDVRKTIVDIAAGTRTQVVATTKQIRELFAASEVLDQSVVDIVDAFDRVGYSYDKVASNLTKSILYVQSVGQNARAVMKDVVSNADQLSRFNFQNGVQGLTKMAAQASMMRFDMKQTFDFADDVLNPEKAIEMASAFQRLGVSVGNLTDPFQLMNQSITDPSGLQTSIINMTKQFTYFDSEAKQFRINPQGILTMQAIQQETGLSADQLRKTAIAAAEMDSKLAKVNQTAMNFKVSEENKMMIANIARMGEEGEYEVSIKDEKGYEYQKKLTELQEDDFQRIIEQQSKAPKTIEDIQRAQLNTAELTLAELRTMVETLKSGVLGLPGMASNIEGASQLARDTAKAVNVALQDIGFRSQMQRLTERAEALKRDKGISDDERKRGLESLYKEARTQLSTDIPRFFKAAGVEISQLGENQNESIRSFTDTITKYFRDAFGAGEAKRTKGLVGDVAGVTGANYGILTTTTEANPNLPSVRAGAVSTQTQQSVVVSFSEEPKIDMNVSLTINGPRIVDEASLTDIIRQSTPKLRETWVDAVKQELITKLSIPAKANRQV